MDCPACREPMVVLELDEVEIDYCISCKGIWLDSGELELLLEDASERDAVFSSFQADSAAQEKSIKCPICSKRMHKVLCGKERKVRIDKCKKDHGIWFDEGELEQVVAIGGFDKENKVPELLIDMFGKKQQ